MDGIRSGMELRASATSVCGSVGPLAETADSVFAVTCSHVVGFLSIGRPQPVGLSEITLAEAGVQTEVCNIGEPLGATIWFSELRPGPSVLCDFALVRLSQRPVADLPENLGQPIDFLRAEQAIPVNTKVALVADRRLLRGIYKEVIKPQQVAVEGFGEKIKYEGLHQVMYAEDTKSQTSGAAVIGVEGFLARVVLGIHIGGAGKKGFFQRLDPFWKDGRFRLFRN